MRLRLEKKLGFDKVRASVRGRCLSVGGAELVDNMRFETRFAKIDRFLNQTDEFREILISNSNFPSQDYIDMRAELERLRLSGTYIETDSLFDLKKSLITLNQCQVFFKNSEEKEYTTLKQLIKHIYIDGNILKSINKILSDDGDILDNASENLLYVRIEKSKKERELSRRMQSILSQSKREGWTEADAEVALRNGRLVIPVSSSNKRKLRGLVHDESSTGLTSYIEPEEIVEINNQIRELEIEERREIIKILTEFTDFLRPHIDDLSYAYNSLVIIDFIRAKALYALEIRAGKPLFENTQRINWFDARHPLLEKSLKKNNKPIVPLRIEINSNNRILIISGPNAGGKSVCLKTVGLLQYMLQSGLLIPIRETSEAGCFNNLIVDIGDEQSIENDLSTYSSHLHNMKYLCQKADSETLFLIDEFGTGTDPSIGGAIAESILEHLNKKKAYGLVTTHYSNLKLLADREEGIINGAMLFDKKNMKPLYELSIGRPGSSFAFEIAETIGLPKAIIKSASAKIGGSHLEFEQQLLDLEREKREISKKSEELRVADGFLSELIEKYNSLSDSLEENKNSIIKEAKEEAKSIILNANRQIENTISEIKTSQAEKEKTQALRKELREEVDKLDKDLRKARTRPKKRVKTPETKLDNSPLEVGDIVRLGMDGAFAEIISIKRNRAEIISDNIKMSINIDRLIKVNKKEYNKQLSQRHRQSNYTTTVYSDINKKRQNFSLQLNIRGLRAEEAMDEVIKYLDEARLLGEREVSILHGKGDGILLSLVRDFLSTHSEVESFGPARLELGGEGITWVKLN